MIPTGQSMVPTGQNVVPTHSGWRVAVVPTYVTHRKGDPSESSRNSPPPGRVAPTPDKDRAGEE